MNGQDKPNEQVTEDMNPTNAPEDAARLSLEKNDGLGEPQPSFKRKKIAIGAVAAAAVLALVGGGAAIAVNQPRAEQPAIQASSKTDAVQAASRQDANEEAPVKLKAVADGWADTSTPVIVRIESDDGKVDFYHAFAANREAAISLKPGAYAIAYISPVNADGSIYKVPASTALKVEAGDGGAAALEAVFERVPADQVTQEQVDEVLSGIRDAVSKGDGTLSGDAGKKVVDQAAANAGKAPNVDKAKVEQAAGEAKREVSEAPAASADANGSANSGNTGNAGSNSSTTTPTGGSNSGGGSASGGSSGGGSAAPEAPAHSHDWIAQTSQQWVPNVVWVQDSAAWDEWVISGSHIETSCGLTFATAEEWFNHQTRNHSCSYSVVDERSMVHHEATGHYEDQGHYETVTTGYVCSGCGAGK